MAVLLISLVSLAVCIALAELFLRLRCVVCSWTESNGKSYVSPYEVPPGENWYHLRAPNETTKYTETEFDYELKTNSLGLRDVEHPVKKEANEFRILGLGDSFMEGVGASFEESYLKVLERSLNKNSRKRIVTIMNAGVSGSDPVFGFRLLADRLLKFKPDLVLVAINASDIYDLIARGGDERFLDGNMIKFARPPTDDLLFRKSHLYRLVVMRGFGYDWFGLSPDDQLKKKRNAIATIKNVIGEFATLGEREGIKLLIVLHPASWEEIIAGEYVFFDAKLLTTYMAEKGIEFVDIMDAFAKHVGKEEKEVKKFFWEKNRHNNAAGYRIYAKSIEEYLRVNNFLNEDL